MEDPVRYDLTKSFRPSDYKSLALPIELRVHIYLKGIEVVLVQLLLINTVIKVLDHPLEYYVSFYILEDNHPCA